MSRRVTSTGAYGFRTDAFRAIRNDKLRGGKAGGPPAAYMRGRANPPRLNDFVALLFTGASRIDRPPATQ